MFKMAVLPAAACALILSAPTFAGAQDRAANRYTMEKTDDGIVRMDTATGEMSLCHERNGRLDCGTMAGEERGVLEDRIDRLEGRLSAMEKEIADLKAGGAGALPSDKDLDRAMGVMEDFMRRFFNMVDGLNRDFKDRTKQPESPPGPQDT